MPEISSPMQQPIKAIIGLGNPGKQYYYNRHNIGFRILDALADYYHTPWHTQDTMQTATIHVNNRSIILIKPQTFMNASGAVIPFLSKQGITPATILVVHDELELPFAKLKFKYGGSAKGHNGLKSIIQYAGPNFNRLSCGIARPLHREDVPAYVLQNFTEDKAATEQMIQDGVALLVEVLEQQKS